MKEALRLQIEAAHRAHLQSQFSIQDGQFSGSIEVSVQKRKLPSDFDTKHPPDQVIRKSQVAYGIQSQDASSSSLEQQQPILDPTLLSAKTVHGAGWLLEGTMRDAYAEHDPVAMFPEPSSTVPNATLTQQRVMEGVFKPTFLGSDVEGGKTPFQPEASIPWSEYLKSPTDTTEPLKSLSQKSTLSQHLLSTASGASPDDKSAFSRSQRQRRESLTLAGFHSQNSSLDGCNNEKVATSPGCMPPVIAEATQAQLGQRATPPPTAQGLARVEMPKSSRSARRENCSQSFESQSDDDDLADPETTNEQYVRHTERRLRLICSFADSSLVPVAQGPLGLARKISSTTPSGLRKLETQTEAEDSLLRLQTSRNHRLHRKESVKYVRWDSHHLRVRVDYESTTVTSRKPSIGSLSMESLMMSLFPTPHRRRKVTTSQAMASSHSSMMVLRE